MTLFGRKNEPWASSSTRHPLWWKIGAFLFALGGLGAVVAATLFAFRFSLFSSALASGPSSNRVLNYQIRLTDPSGIPTADGTKNIKISFYDAVTGGTTLHTDCGTTGTPIGRKVVFTGGVGTVHIGDTAADASHNCTDGSAPNVLPATLFNNTGLFLGLTVEADAEMTPRKRIVATGYSLNADMLDDLDTSAVGGSVAFVPVTDSSGNLTLTKDLTSQAMKDAVGWMQNHGNAEKVKIGYNNGGLGGGATPGNSAMKAEDVSVFDMTAVHANSKGFDGAVFDGRYLYFVPRLSTGVGFEQGQVTRYDTTAPINAVSSYAVFDSTTVNANSKGFFGGVFDGRYVYFTPFYNGTDNSGQITRYDTTGSFTSASSWAVYDTTAVDSNLKGFIGSVFDGRYVYLVPATATASGRIVRYDTTATFTAPGSYSVFNVATVNANAYGFQGAVFDGRHIYFVPNSFGVIARYDTSASFTSAGSYSFFTSTTVHANANGFRFAVFDGRYIYFIPSPNSIFLRYDTAALFTSSSSYGIFDMAAVNASTKGFTGGVFDGRYVYLAPYHNGNYFGQVTRYDTTQPFNSAASYSIFDTTTLNANAKGYNGAIFDGRFVYFVPFYNGAGHGNLVRLRAWAGGVDASPGLARLARSSELYIDSAGNVGIGTATPITKLSIQGANPSATLGSDLAVNGTFAADANWTKGTNWTISGGVATHTAGSASALSQSVSVTNGKSYQIIFTVVPQVVGTLTPSLGSVSGAAIGQTAGPTFTNYEIVLTANTTGSVLLAFTSNAAWHGTIDNVTVKEITKSDALFTLLNSDASVGIEGRSGGIALNNTFLGLGAGGTNTASGSTNTGIGHSALGSNTSGDNNTATGYQALQLNTSGTANTGFGYRALWANTYGTENAAVGVSALSSNTTGSANTAFGAYALTANISAGSNTAIGWGSLSDNTTGIANTAVGWNALTTNTTGYYNTAMGRSALYSTTTGDNISAYGESALYANTTGGSNSAFGSASLRLNTTGTANSAFGLNALYNNTTGQYNTAIGYQAGNTITTGLGNTFVGFDADASSATLTKAIAVGHNAIVSCSNCMALGGTGADAVSVGIGTTTPITQLHVPGKVPSAFVGSVATAGGPQRIHVQGRYAYVITINDPDQLQIFDVSNPSSPTVVSTTATGTTNVWAVRAQGRYVYISTLNDTLLVYDVSDPSAPTLVGSGATGDNPYAMRVQGRYAYLVNATANTLQVMDVGNPALPVSVGSVALGAEPRGIDVQGRYAYVASYGSDQLKVVDVSNPSAPVLVATVATDDQPQGIYAQGRYVYVSHRGSAPTLRAFDVKNPAAPVSVGSVLTQGGGSESLFVQGRYAYNVSLLSPYRLELFDVSNPAAPVSVGSATPAAGGGDIHVQGRYAYIFSGDNLQIFDVGGSYIQQLEAGGIETGTLSARNTIYAVDAAFSGGVTVGQSLNVSGNAAIGTLTANGNLLPAADDTYDLGSSAKRWRDLYLGPASLHIGVNGNEARIGYNTTSNRIEFDSDGDGAADAFIDDAGNFTTDGTVAGGGGSSAAFVNGGNSFGGAATLGTNDAFGLSFETNGATKLSIDTAGNVGIGTTGPAAKLDVSGTADAIQLIVKANSTQSNSNPLIQLRNSGGSEIARLHSDSQFNLFIGTLAGKINNAGGGGTGNTFVGDNSGSLNTTGGSNTAVGRISLTANTTGAFNTAVGVAALGANTTATYNTAVGASSLVANTTGFDNTATGSLSLRFNVSGNRNTASGVESLYSNTASDNTAMGHHAMHANTSGGTNAAFGAKALYSNTTGTQLAAFGESSLYNNTTASYNAAFGQRTLFANTTGSYNTAVGYQAIVSNTTGINNTAVGGSSLYFNTTGNNNTVLGVGSMFFTTTGSNNTAVGGESLYSNTTAGNNTALGQRALYSNTTGSGNTSSGYQSLYLNTAGNDNAAYGAQSLYTNFNGVRNTAIGSIALYFNNTGGDNVAVGRAALYNNTSGSTNTALGEESLNVATTASGNTAAGYASLFSATGSGNTALGYRAGFAGTAITSGTNNTIIGYDAGATSATLTNATAIGYNARVGASNSLVLGGTGADAVNVGIGTTSPSSRLTVQGENSVATLGSDLVTNGTFDTDTAWTKGAGWTISGGLANHAAGNATAIEQNISVTSGTAYQIKFNPQVSVGKLTPSLGSVNGRAVEYSGGFGTSNYEIVLIANTTGSVALKFTADATMSGTIDAVSVKAITPAPALVVLNNSSGVAAVDMRSGGTGAVTVYGLDAGRSITTGTNNAAFGSLAMQSTTSGYGNAVFGNSAFKSNTVGYNNAAFGNNALFANTAGAYNAAFGLGSLGDNTFGINNVGVGASALASNTTGDDNTAVGYAALAFSTTSKYNTAVGSSSLFSNTTGFDNVSLGYRSLYTSTIAAQNTAVGSQSLFSATTGSYNTASGYRSLYLNTTGSYNVSIGYESLRSNTTGNYNSASGYQALYANTIGERNIAMGYRALFSTTSGTDNTGLGYQSLQANTTGFQNSALGHQALVSNTTGNYNSASGSESLFNNTTGTLNTASGFQAIYNNTTGSQNTAVGHRSLFDNTTGTNVVAVGNAAGRTFTPANANTTGSNNTFIGAYAGPGTPTQLTNATAIGYNALVSASNALVLGGTGGSAVNVGIGTATPGTALDVIGSITASGDFLPAAAPIAGATSQTITTVDSADNVGNDVSIAIGGDGLPVMAYLDATNFDLKVTKCGNAACSSGNTVTSVDTTNDVGYDPFIAIGADGLPVISEYDNTNKDLKVVKCGNAACSSGNTITTVDSAGDVGAYSSIAVGTDGFPIVSYLDASSFNLKAAKCVDAACSGAATITTVDSAGDVGWDSSIAIGTDGMPVMSYRDGTNADLKVAKCGNAACSSGNTISTVESTGSVANTTSLVIGTDGLPVISEQDHDPNYDMRIIKCGNTSCSSGNTFTSIDTANSTGLNSSIRIGADGLPVASYFDATGGDLKVVKCGNMSCTSGNTITTVDADNAGFNSSLAIGTDGLPVVAYYFNTSADLKVVKCADAACRSTTGGSLSGGSNLGSLGKFFNNVYAASFWGKQFQIEGFDLAENYSVRDLSIEAGDIIRISSGSYVDGNGPYVERSQAPYEATVIGIVSTKPGIALSEWSKDGSSRPIALAGRVPVKVTDENGPIEVGDAITSSSTPGIGMKATTAGRVLGFALKAWNGNGEGMIDLFVEPGWWNGVTVSGTNEASGLGNVQTLTIDSDADLNGHGLLNVSFLRGMNGNWSIDEAGLLTSKAVVTEKVTTQNLTIKNEGESVTAGIGTVRAGATGELVINPLVNDRSIIVVTFEGDTGARWWISEKEHGKFMVNLSSPAFAETKFSYWIVGLEGGVPPAEPPAPAPEEESAEEAPPQEESPPPVIPPAEPPAPAPEEESAEEAPPQEESPAPPPIEFEPEIPQE